MMMSMMMMMMMMMMMVCDHEYGNGNIDGGG
jgi:hypothetical protein